MEYLETYFNEQYVDSYLIEHWGALLTFISTPVGFLIWLVVTILLPVAICVYFQKNSLLYLMVVILVFSAFIAERALRIPRDEIPNITQEITQTEIKDNTVNLKCTVTETGDYLCKKQK